MRKLIVSLLMASVAATPAVARDRADRDDEVRSERQQSREDRQQSREDRQQSREDRQQSREDRQQSREDRREARDVRVEQTDRDHGASSHADARADRADVERIRTARAGELQQRHQEMRDNRELRQSRRVQQGVRNRPPVVSNVPRPGTQPPLNTSARQSQPVKWNTSWRKNHRYNWYNWRNRHRSLFRLGFYSDPFGWGYQPYSIGWRMWPSYYGSSYWLNDPWQYRLPYAPPGTRWIRYYDDAILVDTWTGQVVDVIYNFFW